MKKRGSTTTTGLTVNGLADASSIDRRTIKKHLAKVKPVGGTEKSPLWTLRQLEEAMEAAKKDGEEGRSLKDQKLAEEVRKLKRVNDEGDRLLVDKSSVIGAIQRIGSHTQSKRLRIEAEWPAKLVGIVSVPEMAGRIKELMDEVMGFANELKKELETV